jgi:cyclophilin family peptidyl-prolyl cis-trans isomerase
MRKEYVFLFGGLVIIIGLAAVLLVKSTSSKKDTFGYSQEDITKTEPTMEKAKPTPKMQIDDTKTYTAVMKTTEGDITIELNARQTPITVNNFVSLAKSKFYNNTIFHRVIKGFMIQGGDPNGNGTGGPGYTISDEPFDGEYIRGTVAMARTVQPNSAGSQFFIMHQDKQLPKDYVIFGKVTEGIDVVDKIAEAKVTTSAMGENSQPVTPVKVKEVVITEK